jgi:hypothetical protein
MNTSSPINFFLTFANQLKFRSLFIVVISLFVIDLLVPDFIPMIDEIILGLLAIILANWKKEKNQDEQGNLIEGEVINEDKE